VLHRLLASADGGRKDLGRKRAERFSKGQPSLHPGEEIKATNAQKKIKSSYSLVKKRKEGCQTKVWKKMGNLELTRRKGAGKGSHCSRKKSTMKTTKVIRDSEGKREKRKEHHSGLKGENSDPGDRRRGGGKKIQIEGDSKYCWGGGGGGLKNHNLCNVPCR